MNEKNFIVYDSKEYGKEYHTTSAPFELGGKFMFLGRHGETWSDPWEMVIDGKVTSLKGRNHGNFAVVDGKFLYTHRIGKKLVVVFDDIEYGAEFDTVYEPEIFDQYFVFRALHGTTSYVVLNGTQKIEYDGTAPTPTAYSVVSGKLFFLQQKTNGSQAIITHAGKKKANLIPRFNDLHVSNSTSLGRTPVEWRGKLAYSAISDNTHYVVYDDMYVPLGYDEIGPLHMIGGKLAFSASKNGKVYILIES
jgi:hypothetical protein